MSVVIPVRVPKKTAKKIKELVDTGLYPNRSSLIREALRKLMVSEARSTQKTNPREVAATLASTMIFWEEKKVTDVILFGSVSRGEATVESDVDLLVLVENAEEWRIRKRLYDLIYPIIPTLGIDVSLIVIDKKNFTHMVQEGDPFALSITKEGTQLQGSFLNEHSKGTLEKSSRETKSR